MQINSKSTITKAVFIIAGIVAVSGLISPPIALGMGLLIALTIGNPFQSNSRKITKSLLQWSVVGLGFGMNINAVIEASRSGIWFTITTVLGTLIIGIVLGRLLKVESKSSALIASGTAICGGSAIAAVAPIIKADAKAISVSLGIVFLLNAIALFIFPILGHMLHLTQAQFGIWSAIAIHDTSSVVGAASHYGEEALRIATTVKLTRALWIVPIALLFAFINKQKGSTITIPWFIVFFILATIVTSLFPSYSNVYAMVKIIAMHGLTLTLFLIGAALSVQDIKSIGYKPMLLAVLLWIGISGVSLVAILTFVK